MHFLRFKMLSQTFKIHFAKHVTLHKILIGIGILLVVFLVSFTSLVVTAKTKKDQKIYTSNKQIVIPPQAPYVPSQLVVKFKDGYAPDSLEKIIKKREASRKNILASPKLLIEDSATKLVGDSLPETELVKIQESLKAIGIISYEKQFESDSQGLRNFYILKFEVGKDVVDIQENLSKLEFLEYTQPNFIYSIDKTPNDPSFSQMGWPQKISAPVAWDKTTGSSSIIVAVLDTGVDVGHPDLASNITVGYDFANNDSNPQDDIGHGTHVGGTIGAIGDNGLGVVGVSWNVKIMPVKVCAPSGCQGADTFKGIEYAADHGARVINMSLGTQAPYVEPCSPAGPYQAVINYAISKGVTVVVSAGNDNRNISSVSPASCLGVLVVGATNANDTRASFSNFGSVKIAAPGVGILATFLRGVSMDSSCGDSNFGSSSDGVGYCSGTSMSSPIVAGAAGLLLSYNPSLAPDQVKDCLIQNGDAITTDKPIGGVRVNIAKAIDNCSTGSPLPTATPTTGTPLPSGGASPSPVTTVSVSPGPSSEEPTATPTSTPTPTGVVTSPTPTPTPVIFYSCHYDPACEQSNPSTIQLCPLVCEKI